MISNHTDLLNQEIERVKGQRDAFKMAADQAIAQRDEARAQLANAAASEVDAVQGRQECERELREARTEMDAIRAALNGYEDSDLASLAEILNSQRLSLARAVVALAAIEGADVYEMGYSTIWKLARSIVEEEGA